MKNNYYLAWKNRPLEYHRFHSQLEELVYERTQDLQESNEQLKTAVTEMETFNYSISHDLKTPLRAINGYSEMIMEDHSDSLDDEGKRLLQTIGSNIRQMGQLIEDILLFSRAGRKPLQKTEVDIAGMAKSIFEELTKQSPEMTIDFQVQESLSHCHCDPPIIRQVLTNLISNAIKFSETRSNPRIEFGSRQSENETVYYIRDNGVGFNNKYGPKAFGLFQRLHSQQEFDGTGVGLAIVQRLIRYHGGHIWAEAAVDEGAAFYFTLERHAKETP